VFNEWKNHEWGLRVGKRVQKNKVAQVQSWARGQILGGKTRAGSANKNNELVPQGGGGQVNATSKTN